MQFEQGKNLINKDNAYAILKAFAKEYRKQNGEKPAEIVIVGGGSIMLNYGFRTSTQDFDIMVSNAGSDLKDIIHRVAELYNLPYDWMNTDFKKTISYSRKLREVSSHLYSFNHESLEFRTVKDEYLVAMKMIAGRGYRNDIFDIVGILIYCINAGAPITYEKVETAMIKLYGNFDQVKPEVVEQVKMYTSMNKDKLVEAYNTLIENEVKNKADLEDIDSKYEGVVIEKSIDDILAAIERKRNK